ncbi:MAG: GGDEF domain-containing phosphodiesterase [Desulfurivibrio sp.]|nr:GGDEF domain-containing phosphodiesterase [Desulfurivibrio sp.]
MPDQDACRPLLRRLLKAASGEVEDNGIDLQVSASLGVTFYPQSENIDADQLLRQADQAMYQAKSSGKCRYHLFDADYDLALRGHHEQLERIAQALQDREFLLYYQPKVNMRTGRVVGLEALIRWQHPELGLLSPGHFLPTIEDHPLAVAVGDWVLETALEQMVAWRRADLSLPVSVNVGPRQLQEADFVAGLRRKLLAHPEAPADQLELEVVESSALGDFDHVSKIIIECRELGVNFALDDFGTGYSSLTYLKRLPAQTLKIDRSFVLDMLDDPEDLAIVEGVLGLATAFRRQVVAEGVETDAHGHRLLKLGCELAQGFGIARPMPAAEVPAWVAAWPAAQLKG